MSPRQVRKYGEELQGLIDIALEVPEFDLPPANIKPANPLSSKALKSLKKVVEEKAIELQVAPEMLARRRHLEQLLRSVDKQGGYVLPAALRGWREEVIGDALLLCLAN